MIADTIYGNSRISYRGFQQLVHHRNQAQGERRNFFLAKVIDSTSRLRSCGVRFQRSATTSAQESFSTVAYRPTYGRLVAGAVARARTTHSPGEV
jgi:hypothetical protein